ncbi:adenine phosphoribosyltransferase [Patescibacteria group bacterium]
MNFKKQIREIPNWPIQGVRFYDFTTLLQNKNGLKQVVDELCKPYKNKKIDKIVAIDARGFLLATPMAYKLKTGVCLVRKKGKLPYKTIKASYKKEYGIDTLTMHKDTIKPNERVLIVDDLIATGGTMQATVRLVEKLKGKIVGIACIIDLPFFGGSKKLSKYKQHFLVSYESG